MNLKTIPHSPGVYLMRDNTGAILYIGKARDLRKRVASYFIKQDHSSKKQALVSGIHHVDYIPTASEREALVVERDLIHRLQPYFNTMWRDDKSYPYVKLTWEEDFPRLVLTRRPKRDGGKYFGPYPNVKHIRRLLRYLWRKKMFPLRQCDYEFNESNLLPLEKAKQCLYYHTKECPAPCVARISKTDYRAIAQEADYFFRGRFNSLADSWQKEMKEASEKQDYERAAVIRDNLTALQHIDEPVTTRQIKVEDLERLTDRSRGITELQQALGLARPPLRIECFDISHFQGLETVASMVSFDRGMPDKSNYRKFKIKTVQGIDDFASMGEVVGRRYRRLLAENKPLPDLILIDGGKGQLSSAHQALLVSMKEANQKASIIPPMAALAKQQEELFLPDRPDSIVLPKDSTALHLVQRVRDEAHRFAITFHRQRRGKRFLH